MYKVSIYAINNPSAVTVIHSTNYDSDSVIVNTSLNMELNKAGSFRFTVLPNHPNYALINQPMFQIVEITDTVGNYIWSGRITSISIDMYAQKVVECEGVLAFLADVTVYNKQYSKKPVTDTFNDLLSWYNTRARHDAKKIQLRNITRWTSDKVASKKITGIASYTSVLQAISELIIKKWGGYIKVVKQNGNLYIDYVKAPGSTINQSITYGQNLISMTRERDLTDVYTAVIPLGKSTGSASDSELDDRLTIGSVNSGVRYLYKSSEVDKYGWIYKVITNSDIDSASELKEWGQEELDDMDWDKVVLQVVAYDMSIEDASYNTLTLGSYVHVYSDLHDTDVTLPISEIRNLDVTKPTSARYTIGIDQRPKITGLSSR